MQFRCYLATYNAAPLYFTAILLRFRYNLQGEVDVTNALVDTARADDVDISTNIFLDVVLR